MRFVFTLLHRWVGLAIAAFLFVSGITGAIISWDHELDGLLNSHLIDARGEGPAQPSLELARRFEAQNPQAWVTYVPLIVVPGYSLALGVNAKIDAATGKPYKIGYNQAFIDPASGEELGRREWGAVWPITSESLVSFLYVLHYSLHIPEMWGIDRWGLWLMGSVALLWTIDCFVGFYLTLPMRRAPDPSRERAVARQLARGWWQRWKPAWKIKTSGSAYRINFDIHRASGLWTWGLLFILAFTGFSLNLYREIFYPLMSTVSQVTPGPFDVRTPKPPNEPIAPKLGYEQVIDIAAREADRQAIDAPVGSIQYSTEYGIYTVRFYQPGDEHGTGGAGPRALYFDGSDGRYLGDYRPWTGTAADIFVQAQFPLHSGRILGVPGRILVSIMGIIVVSLSVTGVVIWLRKRRSRILRARQTGLVPLGQPVPGE
jgi:uncharacterized iron-regulated membrane protein